MKILIVSAFKSELYNLIKRLDCKKKDDGYFYKKIKSDAYYFYTAGMGKTAFSMNYQKIIDKILPDISILTGSCGSLTDKIDIGDLIIPSYCLYGDTGVYLSDGFNKMIFGKKKKYGTSKELYDICREIKPKSDYKVFFEDLICNDYALFNTEQRRKLFELTKCYGTDMESAACAYISNSNNIKCLSVKVVTDKASDKNVTGYTSENFKKFTKKLSLVLDNRNLFNKSINNLTEFMIEYINRISCKEIKSL